MMNYYRNVLYNNTMSVWEKMKSAASATGTAITNTSSKAMSAARQTRASVTDPTSSARAKNAAICKKASDNICNMGKIPVSGDDMYTTKNMTVNGRRLFIRIRTSAGKRRGMEYTEQNKQAIRNALISKGIKPAVGNQVAMDQYNKDMKLYGETYDEIQKAENFANVQQPTTAPEQSAGRRPRRRTRRLSRKPKGKARKPKGKASSKRSRGAKSKGTRRGSRKRR
jgi:hypothetical protein